MSSVWKRLGEIAIEVAVLAVVIVATALAEEVAKALSNRDFEEDSPSDGRSK